MKVSFLLTNRSSVHLPAQRAGSSRGDRSWLLSPDSSFRISWESERPLGDRFNHVFIFSISSLWKVSSRPSSLQTAELHLPSYPNPSLFSALSWPEPNRPTKALCDIYKLPKNAVVCLRVEPESAVDGFLYYYFYFSAVIQLHWALEGMLEHKHRVSSRTSDYLGVLITCWSHPFKHLQWSPSTKRFRYSLQKWPGFMWSRPGLKGFRADLLWFNRFQQINLLLDPDDVWYWWSGNVRETDPSWSLSNVSQTDVWPFSLRVQTTALVSELQNCKVTLS